MQFSALNVSNFDLFHDCLKQGELQCSEPIICRIGDMIPRLFLEVHFVLIFHALEFDQDSLLNISFDFYLHVNACTLSLIVW